MKVLIIGAAGLIGAKLTARLVADGTLNGERITGLTLFDIVKPPVPDGAPFPVTPISGDLSTPGTAEALAADEPDMVFHLAAVVSGEAEVDFDKGYRVNLDGTRHLLEAQRHAGNGPRVVFTSSIAVFGRPFPEPIPDDFALAPLTSYGAQKAIDELMLADYSRKGFLDGIGIRLPTIVVRPGKPNKAASGFFSGIIREPLQNQEAVCPVGGDVRHWMASPKAAIGFLIHAAGLDTAPLGARRTLTMPGLSQTIDDMVDSLRRVAGEDPVKRIRWERDEAISRIVSGWPTDFAASRAIKLGFVADPDFDSIIRDFIQDELQPVSAEPVA